MHCCSMHTFHTRGVDPCGTADMSPNNYEGEGEVHGNVHPQYFRSDVV